MPIRHDAEWMREIAKLPRRGRRLRNCARCGAEYAALRAEHCPPCRAEIRAERLAARAAIRWARIFLP